MLTLTSLARADRHMLLNAGNDVQRWWRLVYTVLIGMVELLRVGICGRCVAFDAPVMEESPSEYCHNVWCGKTMMVWILDGGKSLRIWLTVSTEYRRVTDGQTSCDGIVRAMHSIAR